MKLNRTDLGDLNFFRLVAETGGFRKAAAELDLSPSALSHAMRGLEQRQGVRLFNRTNRSVTLTQAGRELLADVRAGLDAIEAGLERLNRYRDRPAGNLRINVPSDAARLVLAPVVADYMRGYPEVRVEVEINDHVIDIVQEGFDAGIRYGGTVPEDMIALPLGPELRWLTVASPDYLRDAPPLEHPDDLKAHRCVGLRMGTGRIYNWELERGSEEVVLSLDWAVIVNETVLSLEIAENGGAICYTLEDRVRPQLADGRLVHVLPDWWSMGPAFHLYYPSRRQLPEALRALLRSMQRGSR
ncbi:LysR family transcriptional regulator [Amaricoccus solimangrovi]|uniref:LysR family transcriptional regulator n=1 Tax=Amaricoccus solimangrovi TaxID=2589815 RepID=A0A501WAK9_9RHOB|nr:LysR family transcriptional regulator [Amaricoccus solimangrovi]TPE45094.1 LysR family transcriptional regulator [Amaricoccus solimangrovi]